jgi:hypothetical protein
MIYAISTAARDTDRRDLDHRQIEIVGSIGNLGLDQARKTWSRKRTLIGEVKTVADLKLGPLPNQKMTRVTVMLPEPLKEELDAYAVEHSRLYGHVETAALVPHMLQAFLRTDRSWCSRRKRRGKHKPVEPAQPATQT